MHQKLLNFGAYFFKEKLVFFRFIPWGIETNAREAHENITTEREKKKKGFKSILLESWNVNKKDSKRNQTLHDIAKFAIGPYQGLPWGLGAGTEALDR